MELRGGTAGGSSCVVPYGSIGWFEVDCIGSWWCSGECVGMRITREARDGINASLGIGGFHQRTFLLSNDAFVALVPTAHVPEVQKLIAALDHVRDLAEGEST